MGTRKRGPSDSEVRDSGGVTKKPRSWSKRSEGRKMNFKAMGVHRRKPWGTSTENLPRASKGSKKC